MNRTDEIKNSGLKATLPRIKILEITERETTRRTWEPLVKRGNDIDYGYTPPIASTERVEREVLTQELETVDIPAVIKAINGLT